MASDPSDRSSSSSPFSRRHILQGLGAALGTAAIGCAGASNTPPDDSPSAGSDGAGSGGAGGAGQGGAGGQDGSEGEVKVCTGDGGLTPEALLAKVETIVILCMENRSFDHYFGSLLLKEKRAVDGLTGNESNPDANGVPVPIFRLTNFTVESPPHEWEAVHAQWNLGKNDQFVVAHAGLHQQEVMGYHTRSDIPTLYSLADAFTVCDRYFCSVLGPTWPNRFYLHGATSQGQQKNSPITGFTSVFDLLSEAGIRNMNYFGDLPWCAGGYGKVTGVAGIDQFFKDAALGVLPQVSIIDPTFFGAGANDDHPNHDVKLGEALIASVFAALAESPQWDRCLFVITYDEHGGFFDHVPPPATDDANPAFTQLGFRVPTLVAGPFVRKGCVVSTQLEHVSVLKTIARRFNLPDLNARMAGANDLSSCIDPAFLDNPQKPPTLPRVKVSLQRLRAFRPTKIAQPELWAMAESGQIPAHLDRRAQSLEIAEHVLEQGARLGAIEIV